MRSTRGFRHASTRLPGGLGLHQQLAGSGSLVAEERVAGRPSVAPEPPRLGSHRSEHCPGPMKRGG